MGFGAGEKSSPPSSSTAMKCAKPRSAKESWLATSVARTDRNDRSIRAATAAAAAFDRPPTATALLPAACVATAAETFPWLVPRMGAPS